jgi:hypothetical protein
VKQEGSGGIAHRCRRCLLSVVGPVVAAASVTTIVVEAIVPVAAVVVDAVVPDVVAHLMLTLLVVGRIIAAAACLRDGGHRDGAGEG